MNKLLWLGPAGMLLLALAPLPYGYYVLLRFVICGVAVYLAWKHYEALGVHFWVICFGVIGILFNPFVKVHFSRGGWSIVDLACAVVFLVNMKRMRSALAL